MQITEDRAFQAARSIAHTLSEAGFVAYFAGGCVRDWILGRTPKDIDVATSAPPDVILDLFQETRAIGHAFGVVQVRVDEHAFEVATFRTDDAYSDGRRPDSVRFGSPEDDALRRDFTINGLFYDPIQETCIDYVGGQHDLDARILRCIGDPDDRFQEDHLRLLRAIRFAFTLDFTIDPDTFRAIRQHAPHIQRISIERVTNELNRILLESACPGDALECLHDSGLLHEVLPEVTALAGQEQPPQFHPEGDVFTHVKMMLNRMKHPTLTLAYAVLFHDIAKPVTATRTLEPDGSERIRFNRHAQVGADITEDILRRLRLPNQHIEAVAHCVRNHMRFMDVPRMRRATLRRLLGNKWFPVELELHRLDCLCSHGDLANYDFLLEAIDAMQHEPVLPQRWIRGEDILALGVPPGPDIGTWLQRAYDAQLEGHAPDRDSLLEWVTEQIRNAER